MKDSNGEEAGKGPPSRDARLEILDPNDSDLLRDDLKGQTSTHANPPRLEDEGQSGG
ncbi:MAG TPA: hypothetical protein VHZ74_16375 [Bryobacteraceae bacterium]|jgi:hypothetical protein|nr:hypothetical protein [Bryobacteraceae bacterium]